MLIFPKAGIECGMVKSNLYVACSFDVILRVLSTKDTLPAVTVPGVAVNLRLIVVACVVSTSHSFADKILNVDTLQFPHSLAATGLKNL